MQIHFNPVGEPFTRLTGLSRSGAVLTVTWTDPLGDRSEVLDFGPLPDGGTLPPGATDCPMVPGPVWREGEVIHVTVLLPHAEDAPAASVGGDGIGAATLTIEDGASATLPPVQGERQTGPVWSNPIPPVQEDAL